MKKIRSMDIVKSDLPEKFSVISSSSSTLIGYRKLFVMPKLNKQGKLLAITGSTPGETSHT